MKTVNSLPSFLPQDADLKAKDSLGPLSESPKESGFSDLVDQHVMDEGKVTGDKSAQVASETEAATHGRAIANDGNTDAKGEESCQENDSEPSSLSQETNEEKIVDSEALTESEQFISLLYTSDQTLTGSAESSNNQQITNLTISPVSDGSTVVEDVNESELSEEKKPSSISLEHKLKSFSKEELNAREMLQNNTLMQQKGDVSPLGTKESALVKSQSDLLYKVSAESLLSQQAKVEQLLTDEQQSLIDATKDNFDSKRLAEENPIEQGLKIATKGIVSAQTTADLQAQTIALTQTKQNSDAYMEYQSFEALNHNVASDTAQIQKNNVQLQQETFSLLKKDFTDAVKDKVMVMISQKLQQFDISLDPPEFGNMQVRVNLQGEQASVNFVVQNQQAKEALDQNMHKLKEMLAEQGVDVGSTNVEQQNQQQSNDGNHLAHNSDSQSPLSKQDDHNVEHIFSAESFNSPATGVDYYV
ncbi:MAG: flagellar hook-length control protein FliK [Colwellia sp.]